MVATHQIDEQEATQARLDGESLQDDQLRKAGDNAYRRWVNDTYWLLMPIKMFDPGVTRSLHSSLVSDQHVSNNVDEVELTFDDVGLTPGDRYVVRVRRLTGEISSWKMDLEGRDEPIEVEWGGEEYVGLLRLPLERRWRGEDRRILFEDVSIR